MNLAIATSEQARVTQPGSEGVDPEARFVLKLAGSGMASAVEGRPVVTCCGDAFPTRLLAAISSVAHARPEVVVELERIPLGDEREEQRAAIAVLDALCIVFQ